MAFDIASWLGPADDRGIDVPTHLAFAEPVVGLCRRISEVNTGETRLNLEPGEAHSLRLHRRFWAECPPLSYHALGVHVSDPFSLDPQQFLDDFVPVLRQLLVGNELDPHTTTQLAAAAKKSTALALTEVQSRPNALEQRDAEEVPLSLEKANDMERTKSSGAQSALESQRASVKIEINDKMTVIVDRERVSNIGPRHAFLALAALAENETTATIITSKFVSLSHRVQTDVPKNWNKNKKWLENYGITVEKSENKEYDLSGFQIVDFSAIDRKKIEDYLLNREPRVRG